MWNKFFVDRWVLEGNLRISKAKHVFKKGFIDDFRDLSEKKL